MNHKAIGILGLGPKDRRPSELFNFLDSLIDFFSAFATNSLIDLRRSNWIG
jgi:hypothetical protein